MTTLTIRTTCSTCRLTWDVPVHQLVLALPAAADDPSREPSAAFLCRGCGADGTTTVPWRTAAYLIDGGAATLTAPEEDRVRPVYPERRPSTSGRMTLDDLIDLHAALEAHGFSDRSRTERGQTPS